MILLALSLAFCCLYVKEVYPIPEVEVMRAPSAAATRTVASAGTGAPAKADN